MPKKAPELSHVAISRLDSPGFHPVGVIPGMGLLIKGDGTRHWALRTNRCRLQLRMGLGPYEQTTLAQARYAARLAINLIWWYGVYPMSPRMKSFEASHEEVRKHLHGLRRVASKKR